MTTIPQPTAPKSATITPEEALKLLREQLKWIADNTSKTAIRFSAIKSIEATAPDKVAAHVAQQVPDDFNVVVRKAFMTCESYGGEGHDLVLKFNHREDAYAVIEFLLRAGVVK